MEQKDKLATTNNEIWLGENKRLMILLLRPLKLYTANSIN